MSADPQLSHVDLNHPVEIVISREFAAPRERVWRAWTESRQAERWWGPSGFTTTTLSQEFRAGGSWRYIMRGPDGREYPNRIDYVRIEPPEKLVYTLGGDVDGNAVRFDVEVSFETHGAAGDQTKVTMRSVFATAEARDFVIRNFHAVEGGKQCLASLDDYLSAMAGAGPGDTVFSISRHFHATRDRVWQAWTQREHFNQWFGPKGARITQVDLDLRNGGFLHFCMQHPNGMQMWGLWQIREVTPPAKIIFVSCFSNAQREVCPPPFQGLEDYPPEVLTTVTLVEHAGPSKGTLVTVESLPYRATDAQQEFFRSFHGSLRQGWTGTLEQLAEFLDSSR